MIRSVLTLGVAVVLAGAACGGTSSETLDIRFPNTWVILQEPIDAPAQTTLNAADLVASWPQGCDVSYIDRLVNPAGGTRAKLAVATGGSDLLINSLLWTFESAGRASAFVESYRSAPDACWTWSLREGPVPVLGTERELTFASGAPYDYHAEIITDRENRPMIGVEAQVLIASGKSVVLFFTQPNQFGESNQSYLDATIKVFDEIGSEY